MKNAFKILGLEPCLSLPEEALRTAFLAAGKSAHPDAGGGDEVFASVRAAFETLSSPSNRLKHWLDLRGTPAETRGSVDSSLMDLFGTVGEVSQTAESLVRRRSETRSALALAMLERDTQACIERVESTLRLVEAAIGAQTARFSEIENGGIVEMAAVSEIARNLAFLEKWRGSLRGILPRLI